MDLNPFNCLLGLVTVGCHQTKKSADNQLYFLPIMLYKMIFYRISEIKKCCQHYFRDTIKNHFLFDPLDKRETNWNFAGCQMPYFMIVSIAGLGGSVGCVSDWWSGDCGFDPRRVGNILTWGFDHEVFSTVILSLLLIQEGKLSVSAGFQVGPTFPSIPYFFSYSYFSLLFSEHALLSLLFSPKMFEVTKNCDFFLAPSEL